MNNAVIYARYSSDRQREESIEGQIRECRAFAESNGYDVVRIYTDRAMSARTDKRPEFQCMIRDSAKGVFQYVIVYTLDRFSRSRYDAAIYKARLKKNGVKVLSAKEHITSDPSGIILESVLEGYAEYYSAELAMKVKRGMTENVLEKRWPGSVVPFGYSKAPDGTLQPDSNAETVKRIFAAIATGHRISDVIDGLNEQHILTSKGMPFRRGSLQHLLRNKIYIGTYTWSGEEYAGFCQPIVDKAVFDQVQQIFAERSSKRMAKHRNPEFALTGKVTCGECGSPMTGTSGHSKSGSVYYYYRCCTKNNKSEIGKKKSIVCHAKPIRKDELEMLVLKTTIGILRNKEALKEIARQACAAQDALKDDVREESIKAEMKSLQREIDCLIKLSEAGAVSPTLVSRLNAKEEKMSDLRDRLTQMRLDEQVPMRISVEAIEFYFETILKRAEKNGGQTLDAFQGFIRQVKVYEDKIVIFYNYTKTPFCDNPVIAERCSSNAQMVDLKISYSNTISLFVFCEGFCASISRAA